MKIRNPQAWIIPILIVFASINGLIKALTGIRYFPLLIDIVLIILLATGLAIRFSINHPKLGFLDVLGLLFISIAVLEILNPNIPSLQAGIEGFRKFSFMMIGFFIGRYAIGSLTAVKRIVWVLLVIPLLLSLYGIKQYLFPTAIDYRLIDLSSASRVTYLMGGHIRAFSTLSGPFHLGIYLVCSLLLLLAILLRKRRFWFIAAILGIPQIIALLMTVTKSNWLALIAGGFVLILLSARRPLRMFWRITLLALIAVGLIFGGLQFTQNVPELQTLNAGLMALVSPLSAPTFIIRLDLWRETVIPLIKDAILFGYGTGSAGEGLSNLFINTTSVFVTSHNVFFKIQFELGILGLTLFIIYLLFCVLHIWRANRKIQDPFLLMIRDWSLAMTVAILVSGLTGAILDAYPTNLIFWLIIGISTRLYLFEAQESNLRVNLQSAVSSTQA